MSPATNLLTETIQSLAQAARTLPALRAGRPVSPTTLWRWSRHGVPTPAGVIRLETTHLAGRVVTSSEAVARFLKSVAIARSLPHAAATPSSSTPTAVTTSRHRIAKAKLDANGM